MKAEQDLKYALGWNYYTMKFVGIWPEERKWSQPWNYLVLIPCLMMLSFICIPQTINLPLIWGDFNLIVENLSMGNVTITISLLKTIAFWINGKPLKSLLKFISNDWLTMTKETEWVTMINMARFNRKIVKMSTILCCSVVLTYTFLRFFSMKYQGKGLLFRAYFPYDVDLSPNYELTMLAQLVAAFYAATCYTAVDTFVATLILHICGQLSNLQRELKELRGPDEKDFNGRIMKIVEKHEYLNRFADMTENCFNKMLLIQILGCTVQLCFQCFQAIMPADTEENNYLLVQFLFLVLYVIYVMLQLFLYCYVGQKLSAESIAIINAAYDTEWYDMSPRDAKLLIVIMCRARLPLRITAGKFSSFTLNLYTTILKTSMGYVSVLRAMNTK